MSIKAVVFDYGQVISLPLDPKTIDLLAEKAGAAREKFEPLFWSLRGEFDRGTIGEKEYYINILSRLGINTDDKKIDELAAIDAESWKNINTGTVELMEEVKKAGYILGILSNMPHSFLAWARKNIPAFSLPHVSVFSCEVGLIKPEKAIYKTMLTLAGVESGELVFFDENPENVYSARALGIEAFLWKDTETARYKLSSLGVKL
jgi:putative hydrolase of the HAD superfamily